MSTRAEKEASVTGHKGGHPLEILVLILLVPLLIRVSQGLQRHQRLLHRTSSSSSASLFVLLVDYAAVALPLLLASTAASHASVLGGTVVACWSVLLGVMLQGPKTYVSLFELSKEDETEEDGERAAANPALAAVRRDARRHRDAVTTSRGVAVLSTVIAILAVDFPSIFPRRFAKTEWFGTSLMDVGVGAFVFTGALVTASPVGAKVRARRARAAALLAPLLLGGLRWGVNRAVDYQVHVSEYGLDWNFFMTLTVVKLCSDGFAAACARLGVDRPGWLSAALGVSLLILHQSFLSFTPLGEFVLSDGARPESFDLTAPYELVWRNKEGVVSCVGYVALHFLAQGLAWTYERGSGYARFSGYGALLFGSVCFVLSQICGVQVCRRSANATFVVWILAVGSALLGVARWSGSGGPAALASRLSRHQLGVFLVANVMTGLVNLSFDTLRSPPIKALALMSAYLAAICGLVAVVEEYKDRKVVF